MRNRPTDKRRNRTVGDDRDDDGNDHEYTSCDDISACASGPDEHADGDDGNGDDANGDCVTVNYIDVFPYADDGSIGATSACIERRPKCPPRVEDENNRMLARVRA